MGASPALKTHGPYRSRGLTSLPLYRDLSSSSSGSSAGSDRLLPLASYRRNSLVRLIAIIAVSATLIVHFSPTTPAVTAWVPPWPPDTRTMASTPDASDIPPDHRQPLTTSDTWTDSPGWSRFILEPDLGAKHPRPPPTLDQTSLSAECADAWVASGVLCTEAKGSAAHMMLGALDVVQTFVNGTDMRHQAWRAALSVEGEPVEPKDEGSQFVVQGRGTKGNHVREHDELRHSMRSTFQYLPRAAIRRYLLITSDLPEPVVDEQSSDKTLYRRGQVPTWLDLDAVRDGSGSGLVPPIVVRHDSAVFRAPATLHDQASRDEWRRRATPTYNSNALEAQLSNLDVPDAIFYLCDDMFLFRPFQMSDILTPFYGAVFRMYSQLPVDGRPPGTPDSDPEGEWGTLRYSAWLIDERFGRRERAYIAHVAKPFTGAAIREVAVTWSDELSQTSLVRFRGRGPTLNQPFLLTHYVLEAHRQALLWSLLLARFDADRSGTYSFPERQAIVTFLLDASFATADDFADASEPLIFGIRWPERATLDGSRHTTVMEDAGFEQPSATRYVFSSNDGYAMLQLPDTPRGGWPRYERDRPRSGDDPELACVIAVSECFGPAFLDRSDDATDAFAVFRRVSFERPECGDCLIVAGLRNSGDLGLSAFLPPSAAPRRSYAPPTSPIAPIAPMLAVGSPKFGHADFTWRSIESQLESFVDLRDFCVRLIGRYAYSLGESPGRFIMIKSQEPEEFEHTLQQVINTVTGSYQSDPLYRFRTPAFGGLNDDMPDDRPEIDDLMRHFVAKVWPTPGWWERKTDTSV